MNEDKKTTELGILTTPDDADIIPVVDVSDVAMSSRGTNKKSTIGGIRQPVLDAAAADATAKANAAEASAQAAAASALASHIIASDPHPQYTTAAEAAAAAPVQLVAGRSGNVTLSHTDISGLGNSATRNVGTATGTVAAGDDARLSNSRTPTSHADSHATGGSDPVTVAQSQVTNLTTDLDNRVRVDAGQSLTAAQKRTARGNIGFTDSFTTAELLALSASDSARLRIAYCSDCYSSETRPSDLLGDLCFWDGTRWATSSDGLTPTTDWLEYAFALARLGRYQAGSIVTMFGELPPMTTLITSASGAGATSSGGATDGNNLSSFGFRTGSTSSGSVRLSTNLLTNVAQTDLGGRLTCLVLAHLSSPCTSIVGVDELHWRVCMETYVGVTTPSPGVDSFGLLMDDRNTLGYGSTTNTLKAYCRINSSLVQIVDTSINPASMSAYLIVATEPNTPNTNSVRLRIATAGSFGNNLVTWIDRTAVLQSQALSQVTQYAKTLGTTNIGANRRWFRLISRRVNLNVSNAVLA